MIRTLLILTLTLGATVDAAQKGGKVHLRAESKQHGKRAVATQDNMDGMSLPLGASIDWMASADSGNGSGGVWYRYRVTTPDGNQRLIRDFGPNPELFWTTIEAEGFYQMELTVRYLDSGQIDTAVTQFQLLPLAGPNGPAVVSASGHPLVMIYSAPPCLDGSSMKVRYTGPSGAAQETPWKSCMQGTTMNFYVGGLQQESAYQFSHVIMDGSGATSFSRAVTASSGTASGQFASFNVVTPAPIGAVNPIILYASLFQQVVASDLAGNIVWYYPGALTTIARPDTAGRFWGFLETPGVAPELEIVRQIDLAGNTLLETNAGRINEQLSLRGLPLITGFHHEARPLPDGRVLVLAAVEKILNGVQGDGDVDVLGDMILVLDQNLEVTWAWNSFDYLDPARKAILGESCGGPGGAAGCAPFTQAPTVNDWTHGNALQLTADGNILYSVRHQDWIVKIDYQNGAGSGQILWKMGQEGDFSIDSQDPYPWFSHQHDPNFDPNDPTVLYVFDNGNTRQHLDPTAHSRGQAYKIDEQARTATPILNADLGDFSLALGSAARLPNGNFHFDLGWIDTGHGERSRTVEVTPGGEIVFEIQAPTAIYRTFRLPSLYAPDPSSNTATGDGLALRGKRAPAATGR